MRRFQIRHTQLNLCTGTLDRLAATKFPPCRKSIRNVIWQSRQLGHSQSPTMWQGNDVFDHDASEQREESSDKRHRNRRTSHERRAQFPSRSRNRRDTTAATDRKGPRDFDHISFSFSDPFSISCPRSHSRDRSSHTILGQRARSPGYKAVSSSRFQAGLCAGIGENPLNTDICGFGVSLDWHGGMSWSADRGS